MHIPLNFCASKEDEIKNYKDKEDGLLSVDSVGHVHLFLQSFGYLHSNRKIKILHQEYDSQESSNKYIK